MPSNPLSNDMKNGENCLKDSSVNYFDIIYYNKGNEKEKYIGYCKNQKRNGKGSTYFRDGYVQNGFYINDLYIGKLKINTVAKELVEPDIIDDFSKKFNVVIEQYGLDDYNNECLFFVYKGKWNGMMNGYGELTYYEFGYPKLPPKKGFFVNNKYVGKVYKRHTTSEFEIDQNMTDELLVDVYYSNKEIYYGTWVNCQRNREGRCKYPNGDEYKGQWVNDNKEGYGTYIFKNRSVIYEGNFKDNLIDDDNGRLQYPDKSIFVGSFKKGVMNGKGTLTFSDGSICIGTWVENKKEHHFEYKFNDSTLSCEYDDDVPKQLIFSYDGLILNCPDVDLFLSGNSMVQQYSGQIVIAFVKILFKGSICDITSYSYSNVMKMLVSKGNNFATSECTFEKEYYNQVSTEPSYYKVEKTYSSETDDDYEGDIYFQIGWKKRGVW